MVITSIFLQGRGNAQNNTTKNMDNQAKEVVEAMAQQYAANANAHIQLTNKQKLQAARKGYEAISPMAGEKKELYSVKDDLVEDKKGHSIPIRVYKPNNGKKLPVLLYIHGGGFTAGSLETHDIPLRALVNKSGFLIIAVDYRLAPEYPYPTGLNDCYAILEWLSNNGESIGADPKQIFIAGDSAGGNLAAVTTLKARDKKGPSIKSQILIYPNTDLNLNSTSWNQLGDKGYVLTKSDMAANINMYVPKSHDVSEPYLSPLKADDLGKLPETVVITGGFDPLHSEGEAYAKRLKTSRVKVLHWHYPGQIHGFFQLGGVIKQGDDLINRLAVYLRKVADL